MRRTLLHISAGILLALLVTLGGARAASADTSNMLFNPSLEVGDATGAGPVDWSYSTWGDAVTASGAWTGDAHGGTRSARVEITAYPPSSPGGVAGDAKWLPKPVPVKGGAYYAFSDWYKSNRSSAVSVEYWTAGQSLDGDGTWANLFSGIAPASDWTQYQTGFTMPAGAAYARFVHLINGVGWLQTDDHLMAEQPERPGFSAPMISLTFDDGSAGFWTDVRPLLEARNLKTTQYVPTGTLGNDPDLMTKDQLSTLARAGHEIGSHSVTHPFLTTVSDAQLRAEMVDPKAALEAIPGVGSVTNFAYPFGDYDARVIAAEQAAGYASGRSVEEGYNSRLDTQPFDLRVQNIVGPKQATSTLPASPGTTIGDFKSWVDYARAHKYWLVVVFHEVHPDNTPLCANPPAAGDPHPCIGPYDTTVSVFKQMLDYLVSSELQSSVMTVRDALASATSQMSPTAGGVKITPTPPTTDAQLTASPSGFADPNGAALRYSYQWSVNGIAVPGATGPTFDLSQPGHGDPGDKIQVDVKASNPQGYSSPGVSDAVTVASPQAPPGVGTPPTSPTSPTSPTGPGVPAGEADDRTPPRIGVSSPRARFYRVGQTLLVKFSCSDASAVASCKANLGAAGGRAVNVTSGKKLTLSKPGRYVLRIAATDKWGNADVKSVRFQVTKDRTPPRVTVVSPLQRRYARGQLLAVKFSVRDPSGVARSSARVGPAGAKGSKVISGSRVRVSKSGRYVLRITATDGVGNTVTKSVYFTVK